MKKFMIAAALLCASAAHAEQRRIGEWLVIKEPDRFAKVVRGFPPPNKIYALTIQAGQTFGVRCIGNAFSLAFIDADEAKFTKGEPLDVMFRADDGRIYETGGTALSGAMAEIKAYDGMVPAMMKARSVSLRIESRTVKFDRQFTMRGAAKAFASFEEECLLE